MIRYKLDPSTTGVVGVCREPGCGHRELAGNADEARQLRDAHEELMHLKRGRHTAPRRADKGMRTSSRNSPS